MIYILIYKCIDMSVRLHKETTIIIGLKFEVVLMLSVSVTVSVRVRFGS